MERIGELAAFSAAICWTLSAIFFERGIKRIGILAVNFIKVVIALILLTITAAIQRSMPIPFDAQLHTIIFLSLSGVVGFVISDIFLFSAYGTVGPRIAMLFLALSPLMTAGIAYLFLGETLGSRGALGMSLVIVGICITVFGRHGGISISKLNKEDIWGYLCAFAASLGQSIALTLSKFGLGDYDPVSGTQIRVFSAIIGFGLVSIIYENGKSIKKAIRNFDGLKYTAAGAVFGPYLGVTLILFSLQRVSPGIVSTLIGLSPIIIILPEALIFKKKIRAIEILGAFIAVIGTSVFFL